MVVTVDGQGRLVDMVGDSDPFGSMSADDIGRLLLDIMVGGDSPTEVLQAVELIDGYFVDIHIVCEEELRHFVLLDSTELVRSLQRIQQSSNETTLRNESIRRSLHRSGPMARKQLEQAMLVPKDAGMLSILAGEMREPLALLAGHVNILARHCGSDPTALRSIAVLQRAAMRLDKLASSALVAMGEHSIKASDEGSVDLSRLASALLNTFSLQAVGSGINLSVYVPENAPTVEIDDRALRQVLENLVVHAFGGVEKGRIELAFSLGELHLDLEVNAEPEGFSMEWFGPLITTNELLHSYSAGSLALAASQRILRDMDAMVEIVPRIESGYALWFRIPIGARWRAEPAA
ncbi:sensor histidine kinase [Pseudomonas sp. CGJS7]|uniref:sensor histidine kinase n=1 Tax=Pseudomonas sp. CGJS7 TaxID=3109348 RepID=UPI0030097635